jgi:hypothetical protein
MTIGGCAISVKATHDGQQKRGVRSGQAGIVLSGLYPRGVTVTMEQKMWRACVQRARAHSHWDTARERAVSPVESSVARVQHDMQWTGTCTNRSGADLRPPSRVQQRSRLFLGVTTAARKKKGRVDRCRFVLLTFRGQCDVVKRCVWLRLLLLLLWWWWCYSGGSCRRCSRRGFTSAYEAVITEPLTERGVV